MHPTECGECGGRVATSAAAIPFQLRGETVEIQGVEHGRCEQCGEVYLDIGAAEKVQCEAVRQVRASRGLMTPDEIRALRDALSASQAQLERLLGTGPKTVVRWEKGTVFQSATADRLMRLLAAKPDLVSLLEHGHMGAKIGRGGHVKASSDPTRRLPKPRRKAS